MRAGPIKVTGGPSSGFLVFPHNNKRLALDAVTSKCYSGICVFRHLLYGRARRPTLYTEGKIRLNMPEKQYVFIKGVD